MYLAVFITLFVGTLAQYRMPGRCSRHLKHLPADDLSVYANRKWYLLYTFGSQWIGGECPTSIAQQHPNLPRNELVADRLFLKDGKKFEKRRSFIKGDGNALKQNINAYTEVDTPLADFFILDTDVDTYTYGLIYSCVQETPGTKIVTAEVYSTNKTLTTEYAERLHSSFASYPDLEQGRWKIHNHTNCPF